MAELELRRTALEWREVDGEVVALDVHAAEYLATNRTGATLWRELAGGASHEQLVRALIAEFDVDEQTAAGDVDRFLDALRGRGLLA